VHKEDRQDQQWLNKITHEKNRQWLSKTTHTKKMVVTEQRNLQTTRVPKWWLKEKIGND
jgi:hypothetical protein